MEGLVLSEHIKLIEFTYKVAFDTRNIFEITFRSCPSQVNFPG